MKAVQILTGVKWITRQIRGGLSPALAPRYSARQSLSRLMESDFPALYQRGQRSNPEGKGTPLYQQSKTGPAPQK